MALFLEQLLNGVQLGVFLFLLSSGLTLIFGIMGFINLAHGAFYTIGAYALVYFLSLSNNFLVAILATLIFAGIFGYLFEKFIAKPLYTKDHLFHILATVAFIFISHELIMILFGTDPQFVDTPFGLTDNLSIFGIFDYSSYRMFTIFIGALVAFGLYLLINKTRLGMQIRAGESNRLMIQCLGVNINILFAVVFSLGAILAAIAGIFAAPLFSVEVDMGNSIIILCFVCVVIGGVGSILGSFVGSLLIGIVDTLGRAFLPDILAFFFSQEVATNVGSALASIIIYFLMIVVLLIKPKGLFGK